MRFFKRLFVFIGVLALAVIIQAIDLNGPGFEQMRPARPAELAALRQHAKTWLGGLSGPATATLRLKDETAATLARIWNNAGKAFPVVITTHGKTVPQMTATVFRPVCVLGRCLWLAASANAQQSAGPPKPQVKVGVIPLPRFLWQPILRQVDRAGRGAALLDALEEAGPFQRGQNQWSLQIDDPATVRDLTIDFVKAFAPKVGQAQDADALQRFVSLLAQQGAQPTPKTYDAADLIALVFAQASGDNQSEQNLVAAQAIALVLAHPTASSSGVFTGSVRQPGWTPWKDETGKQGIHPPPWTRTHLQGRFDWSLHMATSMALEFLVGQSDTAYAGLLKELSDAAGDGSGFDAGDLKANAFGQALVAAVRRADGQKARGLQACLSDADTVKTLMAGALARETGGDTLTQEAMLNDSKAALEVMREQATAAFLKCAAARTLPAIN